MCEDINIDFGIDENETKKRVDKLKKSILDINIYSEGLLDYLTTNETYSKEILQKYTSSLSLLADDAQCNFLNMWIQRSTFRIFLDE
ncbi:MAG: hypothetical protein IKV73_00455 [Clostridia bacterium]|nr:hypothetical protein [Clostridia bacterium]